MRRGFGIALAWVGATLLALLVASAAVGSVRSQVTDTPTPIGSPSAAALSSEIPPDTTATTTDVATTEPAVTTSTAPAASTTTSVSDPSTTSTSTAPTTVATTTTTATTSSSYSRTFDTEAGSVRVIVTGTEVSFGGAFPNTGWKVELEDAGPERVRVHFERNEEDGEVKFSAWVENGELVTRVETDDD